MLIGSAYGAIDGLFVSNMVGKTALASIAIVTPFVMVLSTLGVMMGAGGGAIQIGRSDAMQKTFDKSISQPSSQCQSNWVVKFFAIHHISNQKGELMELGKHVKEHRARLGMSQEQLAEAIFVSRQTISNWETNRTYPDVQSLLLLSNLFEVSVDELIKGDVEEMKAVITAEAKRMNRLGWVMAVCGIGMVVWVLATALMDLSWAVILVPGIALFILAAISAGMAEKIKRDNQLYTYRAVEAFMRGEDPDVANERNREAGKAYWGKFAAKIVIAAFAGFCFGWGLVSILDNLIG